MLTCNNKRCKHYSKVLEMIPSENWRNCCKASIAKSMPDRVYHVGNSVTIRAFTDTAGVFHAASPRLVVRDEKTIISASPHYRIVATGAHGEYWEAAESAFEGA